MVRQARSKPLIDSFETWLREERKKLSAKGPLAKAIDYQFNHWAAFTRFLDDGRKRDDLLLHEFETLFFHHPTVFQNSDLGERTVDVHANYSHAPSPSVFGSLAGVHDIYGSALAAQPGRS